MFKSLALMFLLTGCITTQATTPTCKETMDTATKGMIYLDNEALTQDAFLYVFKNPAGEGVGFLLEKGPGAERTKKNDKFALIEDCKQGEDIYSVFLYVGKKPAT